MKPIFTRSLLCLGLILLGFARAEGQSWTLDVYGGRVAYDLAASVPGENTAIVGLRYRDPSVGWLYASWGLPLGSDDSTWGAAGLGRRFVQGVSSVDVGLDLGAHGHLYRHAAQSWTGSGGTLELRPVLAISHGSVRLEGRSGWVATGAHYDGSGWSRGVHDSDVRAYIHFGHRIGLTGTLRYLRAEEDEYAFGEGRITVGFGRVTAWGSLGAWASDAFPTTQWGIGLAGRLDELGATRLGVSYRHDASDPIYWNAPRRRWSIGLSRALGRRPRTTSLRPREIDTSVPEVFEQRVTIRVSASESRGGHPSVAGDFTRWKPVSMVRDGNQWIAVFDLHPGVYRYAFRSQTGEWYVPGSVPGRRPDGMGGFVATLIVSGDR